MNRPSTEIKFGKTSSMFSPTHTVQEKKTTENKILVQQYGGGELNLIEGLGALIANAQIGNINNV